MPRLSLYRPNKQNDYRFMDKTISEQFTVGGTDLYIHKYIGPNTSPSVDYTQPEYAVESPLNIQDLLLIHLDFRFFHYPKILHPHDRFHSTQTLKIQVFLY